MSEKRYDFIVIGAGPVGLHAALKAVLLNHSVAVIDKGQRHSRAFFVPEIANIPGLRNISGRELLRLERKELPRHEDARIEDSVEVTDIEPIGENGFRVVGKEAKAGGKKRTYLARCVIMATGVVDRQPEIGGSIRTILPYADKGMVFYCLLCDGHRLKGKKVAVIGYTDHAVEIAGHATRFSPKSVTLLANGKRLFAGQELGRKREGEFRSLLRDSGINVIESNIAELFGLDRYMFGVKFSNGKSMEFDRALAALGNFAVNNALLNKFRPMLSHDGLVKVDGDCQVLRQKSTPIPGIYAVGDVVDEWHQIPVGWGAAERAVIHAHMEYWV